MPIHITARVAWHLDGWNGHVCRNPAANRFCVGQHSYPGTEILEKRNLEWELEVAGQSCAQLPEPPPCMFSINAFGAESFTVHNDPPGFFKSGKRVSWELPPASVGIWNFDAMYTDEVKLPGGGFDSQKRLALEQAFFEAIEPRKSLVVYYANYSNPLSSDDEKRYAIVGLARIKQLGELQHYPEADKETQRKYGAFAWQMTVETLYPDQGMRIPYHRYLDQPEILERITLIPDNSENFKYGSRHLTDDDALVLIERFVEIASYLREIGDDSENWSVRLSWLNGLLAELWRSRGLYPGLARILKVAGLEETIPACQKAVASHQEQEFHKAVFDWLDNPGSPLPGKQPSAADAANIRRNWQLRTEPEQQLLRDILPRFDLPAEYFDTILSDSRAEHGITASPADLISNPYLLTEQFVGDYAGQYISFSRIDHGVLPSPELGGAFLHQPNDWRRLRALCVDRLRAESKHTFVSGGQLLQEINHKLSFLPEWKRTEFTERYLTVDRKVLEEMLVLRPEGARQYMYLRSVYDDEREIESQLRKLVTRPDISFKRPVTAAFWEGLLADPQSSLMQQDREAYTAAIQQQAQVCARVFTRPVSVVCGAAGTGKTTIIKALLQGVEKAHGSASSFLLLAPTGKAADRIREKTGKSAETIHKFLARHGWLNENMTLKQSGGEREAGVTTYVIDEASMLDLGLLAALFRAINWNTVQRLIIVGDPNQLPPIGRGKVFADLIDWLREHHPDNVGELTVNLRQMGNRLEGAGTGILDLASLYVRPAKGVLKNEETGLRAEGLFQKLQDLPENGAVDQDLRVLYWENAEHLQEILVDQMVADMEADTGQVLDPNARFKLWQRAVKDEHGAYRPDYQQVISPYRNEPFGTAVINERLQYEARQSAIDQVGALAGITLGDKVMQVRNRGASDPLIAFDFKDYQSVGGQVFNGELGYVVPHGFDKSNVRKPHFRLNRFSVRFDRKQHLAFGYGKELGKFTWKGKTRWANEEKPEDNLELAYAISVHKSQGSEFERVYFILPKHKATLLSPELFYTGITRASRHCTILVEDDIVPLLRIFRPGASHLVGINASLFDFTPAPDGATQLREAAYLEEGRLHQTLAPAMVRSKSEVIISNLLFERDIPFFYELPLYASDGSFYLPDFTIKWRGETYFWEHLGMLDHNDYRRRWETKKAWYEHHFPGQLITTEESGNLSPDAQRVVEQWFI